MDFSPPTPPSTNDHFYVTEGEVAAAILSLPVGSSAGPDGLRPQHLIDMLSSEPSDPRFAPLLSALSAFCTLVLDGQVPEAVLPFFFGARLIVLSKDNGGVRPIAVGGSLQRLVAKVAVQQVSCQLSPIFSPCQLGFGVRGGIEAAVYAARHFLDQLSEDEALVKPECF